jgi:hypothetical protein
MIHFLNIEIINLLIIKVTSLIKQSQINLFSLETLDGNIFPFS